MKKAILLSGLLLATSISVNAMPDGMPAGGFNGFNPSVMAPGTIGAYEMQLLRDRKQMDYINEDFKLYQKKKELGDKVDPELVKSEAEEVELDTNANTFVKKIKNKGYSTQSIHQQTAKEKIDKANTDIKEIKTQIKSDVDNTVNELKENTDSVTDKFTESQTQLQEVQNNVEAMIESKAQDAVKATEQAENSIKNIKNDVIDSTFNLENQIREEMKQEAEKLKPVVSTETKKTQTMPHQIKFDDFDFSLDEGSIELLESN